MDIFWYNLAQPDLHGDPESVEILRQPRDWLRVLKQTLSVSGLSKINLIPPAEHQHTNCIFFFEDPSEAVSPHKMYLI